MTSINADHEYWVVVNTVNHDNKIHINCALSDVRWLHIIIDAIERLIEQIIIDCARLWNVQLCNANCERRTICSMMFIGKDVFS